MKIGIGLIGAGLMGAAHSLMLKQIATFDGMDVELVAAADTAGDRIGGFAAGFGYREHYSDPARVLGHPDVNAVYITTPTRYHRELLEEAVSQGKHVFCEKPLAFTEAEAKAMLDAAESAGVKHQVGLVLRYSPTFNAVRKMLEGDLGFPMTVIFRDDQVFPIKGVHFTAWRGRVEEAGGGTIIEHSIHDVDLLTWLFGPIKSVEAQLSYMAGYEGIEDRALVRFEFESGMTGTLVSLWHDVLKRPSNRLIEIFYQKGFISTDEDFLGPIKQQFGKNGLKTIPRDKVLKDYLEEIGLDEKQAGMLASAAYGFEDLAFLKAIMEDWRPAPGLEVAVAAHRIVDAIYESAKKRAPVELGKS